MDRKILLSSYENPPPPPSPLFPATGNTSDLNNKVSPSVLLIIIILAIIFFISGLLHLLVRFLVKPSNRDPDELDNVTVLQGQLQQLFNLHDSGVDQSFIDTLPVFTYKSIIGVKNPFDCAVCLCEFEGEDKLRLLPKCSHGFHMDCIDTWLLSHSTCPLCRDTLISDYTTNPCYSPIVLVLESGSVENSSEIVNDSAIQRANSHLSSVRVYRDEEFEFEFDVSSNLGENEAKEEVGNEKVVRIKLGKFKNVDNIGGNGGEKSKIDDRRCFSMGSFEYIMDDNSSLQVPIRAQIKKHDSKKLNGHRAAMSECGGDSRRDFTGIEAYGSVSGGIGGGAAIEPPFLRRNIAGDELKSPEMGCEDQDVESCHSLDSQVANPPSFGRRTLLWLMGRQQNKVVHSSFSTNI